MNLAERLRHARERANLTQSQVKSQTGIGESSLSDFERGEREPKLSQLQALAKVYRRNLSFFLNDKPIQPETVLWREKPVENINEIESDFRKLCEQYHHLEQLTGESQTSCLREGAGTLESFSYEDAEKLAIETRKVLDLGDQPGPNLLRVLEEDCNVKIFHKEFQPSGTAASMKSEDFGLAILLNSTNVRWRRNFDLAHELFHLLTWSIFRTDSRDTSLVASGSEEQFANSFASNILMPADAVREAITKFKKKGSVPIEAIFDIARLFDVSTEALIWRMHFLYNWNPESEITNRILNQVKNLSESYEKRIRKDTKPSDWPERYQALAIKALRQGNLSIGRFAEYLEISRQKAMKYIEPEVETGEKIEFVNV